jgi:chromosome segregation ATPase
LHPNTRARSTSEGGWEENDLGETNEPLSEEEHVVLTTSQVKHIELQFAEVEDERTKLAEQLATETQHKHGVATELNQVKTQRTQLEQEVQDKKNRLQTADRIRQTLIENVEKFDRELATKDLEVTQLKQKLKSLHLRMEQVSVLDLGGAAKRKLEKRCLQLIEDKKEARMKMNPTDHQKEIIQMVEGSEKRVMELQKQLMEKAGKVKLSGEFERRWFVKELKGRDSEIDQLQLTVQQLKGMGEHLGGIY